MDGMYANNDESFLGGVFGGADMSCQNVLCWVLVATMVVVLIILVLWLVRRVWMMATGKEGLAMRGKCCARPNLMTLRTVEFPAGENGNCCGTGCGAFGGVCCDAASLVDSKVDNVLPGPCSSGTCGVGMYANGGAEGFDVAMANAPGVGNQVCNCVRPWSKPCSNTMYDENNLRNLVDYKA